MSDKIKQQDLIKQQDKIKVWKCEECTAPEPCRKMSGPIDFMCINKANQKWTICDKYQITERKPEPQSTDESENDGTPISPAELSAWTDDITRIIKERNVGKPTQIDASVMGVKHGRPGKSNSQESYMSMAVRLAGWLSLNSGYNQENYQRPEVIICEFLNNEFGVKPETMTEKMVKAFDPEIKKIMELAPRKRVKIIWSECTKENVCIANALKEVDGDDLDEKNCDRFRTLAGVVLFSDIPKSWLEDIPAEPVSVETAFKEIWNTKVDVELWNISFPPFKKGWDANEANNELRHAETIQFREWFDKNEKWESYPHLDFLAYETWIASQKSRGLS